jgi:erythritol kinase (D-erythritol 1-phosphate-forming)
MLSVCLDMGTSMIKAVAFDEQGGERALVRRPMEVLRPKPGFAEQDMNALWDAVASSVREVVEQLDAEVEMLAFTGQGDGCWLVDEQGQPTGAAVLWNDARNAVRLQEWERDGTLERAFEINGSLGFPGLPNAVLPWLREHEPERVTRAHRSMFCDGWIFLRLTGEFGIDESDASVPLLDIRRGEYSDELLETFDLQWARELLPEIRRGESSLGKLSADAAAATGLQEGLPVVMAPFDIAATAIGCGAVDTGQACSILGTTLCTEVVADNVDTSGSAAGFTIAMGVPDRYLRVFAAMAGTDVIDWAVATLGLSDAPELGELAARAEPGAAGLVVLPHPFAGRRARAVPRPGRAWDRVRADRRAQPRGRRPGRVRWAHSRGAGMPEHRGHRVDRAAALRRRRGKRLLVPADRRRDRTPHPPLGRLGGRSEGSLHHRSGRHRSRAGFRDGGLAAGYRGR